MFYVTLQIMHPTGSIMSCCSNDAFKKYQHGKFCPLKTVMLRVSPAGRVKYNIISPQMLRVALHVIFAVDWVNRWSYIICTKESLIHYSAAFKEHKILIMWLKCDNILPYVVHETRIRKRILAQTTYIPLLEVSLCLWCTRSSITAFIVVVRQRVLCCRCLSSVAVGFHCIDKFVLFIPHFMFWYLFSCLGYIHCCMVGWFYVMNPEGHERN